MGVVNDSLAQNAALFDAVFETLPLEVLVHDPTTIVLTNAASRAVFGATFPEELEGLPITRIVHPDGIAAGNERRRLVVDRGQCFPAVTVKLRTLKGDVFYADGMACRIRIGESPYVLVVQATFGGTGLPAAGGFVSRSADYPEGTPVSRAAVDSLPTPLVLHDATHIIYVNEAAKRAFRASEEEQLVGRPMCDILHPDGREAGMERRRLLFEKGYSFSEVSAKTVACDGTTLYTVASGGAVNLDDDTRVGFCSVHSIDAEPGRPSFVR